jgi:hypothetical protein
MLDFLDHARVGGLSDSRLKLLMGYSCLPGLVGIIVSSYNKRFEVLVHENGYTINVYKVGASPTTLVEKSFKQVHLRFLDFFDDELNRKGVKYEVANGEE